MNNKELSITASVEINASPKEVWQAIIDPEMVKQYFFGTEVESSWRVGEPIIFRGEWEGRAYEDKGTILELEPEQKLKFNYWSNFSGTEDAPENYADITYTLKPNEDRTELTVTQEGFENQEKRDRSKESWGTVLSGMKDLLENGK